MKKGVPPEEGVIKKIWGDKLRICLAYPSTYRAGMSNLGFQTVYRLFNDHPQVLCERIFLTFPGERLVSVESGRPIRDFHILAFSLSFENDYPGVLQILSRGGIEIEKERRTDKTPLVVAGGVAPTLNPEPLADFIDLFLIGEGEVTIPIFLQSCLEGFKAGLHRFDLLEMIQKNIPYAYVPSLYEVSYGKEEKIIAFSPKIKGIPQKVKRAWVKDINSAPCEQVIVTEETELGSMYLVEVNRGCGRGCRFCAAGFVYRPARFRQVDSLRESISRGVEKTGRVGLLGTAVSDHPELVALCRHVVEKGGELAIGSVRLDRLSGEVTDLLVAGGVKTVSIAPEAGSQRLRNLINKGLEEHHIWEALSLLLTRGIENLRVYFMFGLPSEGEEDVEALIELIENIAACGIKTNGKEKRFKSITVSLNPFIPKPATPLQWEPLATGKYLNACIRKVKRALSRVPHVDVRATSYRESYLQALFTLGDRRVGRILKARHDGLNWGQILRQNLPYPDFWVHRRKEMDEILPWDFIDHGFKKDFLIKEFHQISIDKYRSV